MTSCLRWSEGSCNSLPHVRPFIRSPIRLLPLQLLPVGGSSGPARTAARGWFRYRWLAALSQILLHLHRHRGGLILNLRSGSF